MKQYISLAIFLELLKKDKVTAKELSQKFEISVRSVYRYLSELESAGVPTFSIQGKNGGVGIKKNFVLDSIVLNEHERYVLKNCLMAVNTYNTRELIKKLDL